MVLSSKYELPVFLDHPICLGTELLVCTQPLLSWLYSTVLLWTSHPLEIKILEVRAMETLCFAVPGPSQGWALVRVRKCPKGPKRGLEDQGRGWGILRKQWMGAWGQSQGLGPFQRESGWNVPGDTEGYLSGQGVGRVRAESI
jgi:hypothetical protein